MLKMQLLDNVWIGIIALGIAFVLVKLIVIRYLGIERLAPNIFFFSLRNTNRYIIENSDTMATKRYLRISNSLNRVFYTIGASILFMYVFFKFFI